MRKLIITFAALALFLGPPIGFGVWHLISQSGSSGTIEAVTIAVISAGVVFAIIWLLKAWWEIYKLPSGALTRSWGWVVLLFLFISFLIWLFSGKAGIQALVTKAAQVQTYLGAKLQVWSTPNTGPSHRTGQQVQQPNIDWSAWLDWALQPDHILIGIMIAGFGGYLISAVWPKKKKG